MANGEWRIDGVDRSRPLLFATHHSLFACIRKDAHGRSSSPFSTTHAGDVDRRTKTARRADHEDLARRHRRTVQRAIAQSGDGAAHVRPARLPALALLGADEAQRVRDPDPGPAVALAGRVV